MAFELKPRALIALLCATALGGPLLTAQAQVVPEAPPVRSSALSAAEQDARQAMSSAKAHQKAGRLDEALAAYTRARDLRRQDPAARAALAVSEYRIAEVLESQLRYGEALAASQRALALDEATLGNRHLQVAIDLLQQAQLQRQLGRFDEALASRRRALEIRKERLGEDHPAVADALDSLSWHLQEMGRYGEALPLAQRSLAIREARYGAAHSKVAESLNSIAAIYNMLGRHQEALSLEERVLALREMQYGEKNRWTISALNNLAGTLDDLGRRDESIAMYRRALALTEAMTSPLDPELAQRLNNLGYALREAGRPAEALPLFLRSLKIREQVLGAAHPEVARSLRHIGATYLALDQPRQAGPYLERAMRVLALQELAHPVLTASAQQSLADYFQRIGQPNLAILYGKLAINTVQGLRRGLLSLDEESQRSFLDRHAAAYQKVAGWLIDAGRLSEAQQIMSILKEEEYHDYIRRDASADGRNTAATLTTQERQWAEQFQKLGGELFALAEQQRLLKKRQDSGEALSAADEQGLKDLEQRLDAADRSFAQAMDELRKNLRSLDADARAEQERRTMDESLRGVLTELGDKVMLLHTITLPDHVRLLLTHAEARKAYRVTISRSELNQRIQQLLAALKNPGVDPRPAAAGLYEVLIKPIEADLAQAGTRHLMLSLDGALRYVPMAVLWDGRQYLAERLALSLYIDASRDRMKDAPRAVWSVAGLGVSQAHTVGPNAFIALPSVPAELASIVRTADNPEGALQGTALLDGQFSADSLRGVLARNPAVVHIASHFKFSPGTEQDSFLLLGDGKPLSLFELRTGRYDLQRVDLLTLSACETGVDGSGQGNEVEGLAVTAQRKGAKAVLASLWPVEDSSTSALMKRFYQLREQKMSKAEALRRAQLELLNGSLKAPLLAKGDTRGARNSAQAAGARPFQASADKPYAHPYFWAPFVLMGNWL